MLNDFKLTSPANLAQVQESAYLHSQLAFLEDYVIACYRILMKKLFYLILILSSQIYGQEIKGYLYDSEGRVSGFPVWNISGNNSAESDVNGHFVISAEVGDTLVFSSVAYNRYILAVEKTHFENEIVVELSYNSLNEVRINSYNIKPVNTEELDSELTKQIRKDIIDNPTLYTPSKGNIGYLITSIIGLFVKKDKVLEQPLDERKLAAKDFTFLFENDRVLNKNFLFKELRIPNEYHDLFMKYLGSKNLSLFYLEEKKRLDLIEAIYRSTREYNASISASENKDL